MPTILIDRKSVAALPPVAKTTVFYDVKLTGFGLRLTTSGVKTYIVEYRPGAGGRGINKKRMSIGRDGPAFRADAARAKAELILAQVTLGTDPGSERTKRRRAERVSDLLQVYLSDRIAVTRKPKTYEAFEGLVRNWIAPELGSKVAIDLTRADVSRMHRKIGINRRVTANRCVALLHAAYAFAADEGLLPADNPNPAARVDRFVERARDRFLSEEEIARLGATLRLAETSGLPWTIDQSKKTKHLNRTISSTKIDPFAAAAIRLLLLTGARLREILDLEWSEVDLDRGLLRLPDSKTGAKTILIGPAAVQILNGLPRLGRFVIAGRLAIESSGSTAYGKRADIKKPWASVSTHAGLTGVRVHDLRHSYASIGASSGLGLQIVGRLLGHASPATTARYSHFADDPLRRASDTISDSIAASLTGGR